MVAKYKGFNIRQWINEYKSQFGVVPLSTWSMSDDRLVEAMKAMEKAMENKEPIKKDPALEGLPDDAVL